MEQRFLKQSNISVSCLGLGTMTYGEQNTQQEAFEQMDCALAAGINFIDTAEMYPVPPKEETFTETEKIIGNWLEQRKCRGRVVLASKVAGPTVESRAMGAYIRDGKNHLTAKNIEAALHGSLSRLQTDCIDLYQVHWPNRQTNAFAKLGFTEPSQTDEEEAQIPETLEALENLRKAGKIRAFGISNETPWGTMSYLSESEKNGWQKIDTIQNPYNLLNRIYEIGLAEISHREAVGLLVYSPLAFGTLTGKYLDGLKPATARLTRFSRFQRYKTVNAEKAIKAYVELAKENQLDPAQMALAFARTRPFVTSVLLGATSVKQLETNIASSELTLSENVLDEIEMIHNRNPNPCP